MSEDENATRVLGSVKWFDASKGFGFVVADEGGPDILLHANVLRNFGQGSVADGAGIEVEVQNTSRGVQAVEVLRILPPRAAVVTHLEDIDNCEIDETDLEYVPARIKWFDKVKGFGFANQFGSLDDIFVHVEVLRRAGFADLQPGEAVCLKVIEGKRGLLASSIAPWDAASG